MKEIVLHTMEYFGSSVTTFCEVEQYSSNYYDEYKVVYEECFHEMREALGLVPFDSCGPKEELEENRNNIFLLRENNLIIGSVAIYGSEIDEVVVKKEYQNKGYGKKLLLLAVKKLQQKEAPVIFLRVTDWNKKAIKLYEKNGFKITKTEKIQIRNTSEE